MEATSKLRSDARITLIDATELDDEQFNDLITSIDPRGSIIPILCILAIILALVAIA
jgi:hypothetical protein